MPSDFFRNVRIEQTHEYQNEMLALPIRYYDYTEMSAAFTASAARVQTLLPARLRPVLTWPGRTVLVIAAMEYRHFSARPDGAEDEPYNEVALMFPVVGQAATNLPWLPLLAPGRYRSFGWYVHHLPVTTELARYGGITAWGFPKFLAEITFTETDRARSCRLRAGGKEILTLEVDKLSPRRPQVDYYLYSVQDGELLRTRFETRGLHGSAAFRGGASYTLGDHPIADELRALQLGRRALVREYAPRMQALLHAAEGRDAGRQEPQRTLVAAGH